MFEEEDISLLMTLLDAFADNHYKELGRICEDRGIKLDDVKKAHRRVCEAMGIDPSWSEG